MTEALMEEAIRSAGYEVRVSHLRLPMLLFDRHPIDLELDWDELTVDERMAILHKYTRPRHELKGKAISPRGGICHAKVVKVDGDTVTPIAEGLAYCSYTDNYVKHTGRIKAVGRAFASFLDFIVEAT